MTIVVVTSNGDKLDFEADTWETGVDGQDEGSLWVGDEEAGIGVAQFAPGAWAYVYESKQEETTKAEDPDVVESLTVELVADGSVWEDEDGDLLKVQDGYWRRKYHDENYWFSLEYPADELFYNAANCGPYKRVSK